MDKERLTKILDDHKLWLSNGGGNRADLSDADLRDADLRGAVLSGAVLRGADLSRTCLDLVLLDIQRLFVQECPPTKHGGRIVWRTAQSRFIGSTSYKPGRTYIAPVVSADIVTECHPGIYAASRQWFERNDYDDKLVRCYVRDGDWFITAKGAIRCKRLRVLSCE